MSTQEITGDVFVEVTGLRFTYPAARRGQDGRVALREITFAVGRGEIFGLLGPNGGGKTTLIRILSTLMRPEAGTVRIGGREASSDPAGIRRLLGVAFQSPSLDRKLTASENLLHQGHLYGLRGAELRTRMAEVLRLVGLADRAPEPVEKLSGGMARRVELAKTLLHRPALLLMDEPSTGLDPGARLDLWDHLLGLRRREGTTIVISTHLMEEAARCDRIALIDGGRIVALGTPDELISEIAGEVITVQAAEPDSLAAEIAGRFGCTASVLAGSIRIEHGEGHRFVPQLVEAFPGRIKAVTVGRPTLEDVFIRRTGHRLSEDGPR